MRRTPRQILVVTIALTFAFFISCRSSSSSGGFEILGPADETDEAGRIVAEANVDLKKIKVLYDQNEDKRQQLKTALEANNTAEVKNYGIEIFQWKNN